MELRRYLEILRRQKWLVIEAVVIVAVVAGLLSGMRTPVYESSARILLRPNDPSEQLYPGYQVTVFSDPDRVVAAEMDLIESPAVARAAAKEIDGSDATTLLGEVAASQAGMSDLIDITGTSIDPEHASEVANAFAAAYIEDRRLYAVAGLQRAVDDIDGRLTVLERKIAKYDVQIVDEGETDASTELPTITGSGVVAPTAPDIAGPDGTGLDIGSTPTNNQTLKAARYAAATQYQSLFFRQQELIVDISLKRGAAELVSEATTPTTPVSPKPTRDGVLGAFLGLLLGIGVAFVRETVDDRVRDRAEIEEATGLPVIAELPIDEDIAKSPERLPALDRPHAPIAEAMRSLRTNLAFLAVEAPLHRLVVTSPGPGDGKSLVAMNLATAYAQAGFETILVSSDLRRPRLDDVFTGRLSASAAGIAATSPGLTQLVAGLASHPSGGNGRADGGAGADSGAGARTRIEVEAALVGTGIANLRFLPAGTRPPNPAELLGSRRMTEVLDHLSALADVVILDAPPALAVTDAAVLAAKADGVLVVAALGETHRTALSRLRSSFGESATRLLGVVVNKVEPKRGYHGYYHYRDYYATDEKPKRRLRLFGRRAAAKPKTPAITEALEPDLVAAARGRGKNGDRDRDASVEIGERSHS